MEGGFVLHDSSFVRYIYMSPHNNALVVTYEAIKETRWFEFHTSTIQYNELSNKLSIEDDKSKVELCVFIDHTAQAINLCKHWKKQKKNHGKVRPYDTEMEIELNCTKQTLEELKCKLLATQQQLQQLQHNNDQLKITNNQLLPDIIQIDNSNINSLLTAAKNELITLRKKHEETLNTLFATQNELLASQNELQSIKRQQKSTQERFENIQSELLSTRADLTSSEEYLGQLQKDFKSSNKLSKSRYEELEHVKQLLVQTQQQLQGANQKLKESNGQAEMVRAMNKDSEAALLSMQQRLAESEDNYKASASQVFNLSATQAKLNGMFEMGGTVLSCASKFEELNSDLVNIVWDMSSEENEIDILFPIISKIAFHEFWVTVMQTDEEVRQDKKIETSKKLLHDNNLVDKFASLLTSAAQVTINSSGDFNGNMFFGPECALHNFYKLCVEWHAIMTLCDPVLELLPKDRIPKKGSLLNNIIGQPFEFDFGAIGCPLIDCVEAPGLRVRDLNGTILQKAKLKCYFPAKK